jgi:hypothetical protein
MYIHDRQYILAQEDNVYPYSPDLFFGNRCTQLRWARSMIHLFLFVSLVGVVALGLWRRYVSDIADIPGPVLASVGRVWNLWRLVKGDIDQQCIALHEKHGLSIMITSCSYNLITSKGRSSVSVMTK